ncbi:Zinc-binding dehydrogenase [Ceratobasidium sp. AG-Ba]|nr:Zinc-binding dehydrogenase [Ceratobasidium sp. AG-Ba]QRW04773.1 Zinc-binding dehydrogenase [Ceratobasidium sp. AG-Ba]
MSIPTSAQAWRFPQDPKTWNGHKSLALREVKFGPPAKGEVLVKLHAVSLNFRGQYPGPYNPGPDGEGLIPASDGAGEVVAVGQGVSQWKVGDRVHSLFFETWFTGPITDEHALHTTGGGAPGCLTQYRNSKAETLLPIPAHLSYEEASTIPCAALTAWHSFFEKKPITADSTVLVLGSGGVSVFGAQLAKAAGAKVIATTSSKEKAKKYKELGVDEVINYKEVPEWSTKIKELTGGKGVDQVLEVGGQGTLVQSLKSVKREGFVHVIGVVAGGNPGGASLQDVAFTLLFNQATMSGILVGSNEMAKHLDEFMTAHKIKPVIDRVFGWTEVVEALDYQLSGSHFGKVVVKIE